MPKKLSINVDPSTAPETVGGGKNLTIVSSNNDPRNAAVKKQINTNHKELKQQQDEIMKEIAEIQKQEDLEEAKIKEEEKNEVEEKR